MERRGIRVITLNDQFDLLLEFAYAGEGIASNRALSDQRKPSLDLIEPRTVRWYKVEVKSGMSSQPCFYSGVLMRDVIVHDQM